MVLSEQEMLAYYDTLDMPLASKFLFDREYLIPLYKRRQEFAQAKWRKARRAMWWYRLVPFVRVVFVSGSLSINNTDELSDIDLIIVAKSGRIWLVRAFTLALFQALGVLRKHIHHTGHAPDKICPNHYITDQSLAIPFQNIYTAQLYSTLVPVIIRDPALVENFKKANAWVEQYFPWRLAQGNSLRNCLRDVVAEVVGWILGGKMGDWLEKMAEKYQRRRIAGNAVVPVPGGHLICNDQMLAFHSGSSQNEILKKYEENLKKLYANH